MWKNIDLHIPIHFHGIAFLLHFFLSVRIILGTIVCICNVFFNVKQIKSERKKMEYKLNSIQYKYSELM